MGWKIGLVDRPSHSRASLHFFLSIHQMVMCFAFGTGPPLPFLVKHAHYYPLARLDCHLNGQSFKTIVGNVLMGSNAATSTFEDMTHILDAIHNQTFCPPPPPPTVNHNWSQKLDIGAKVVGCGGILCNVKRFALSSIATFWGPSWLIFRAFTLFDGSKQVKPG